MYLKEGLWKPLFEHIPETRSRYLRRHAVLRTDLDVICFKA
jgi:hypothetical protein